MTNIFFVRHAQPDKFWLDDRTRPLTEQGMKDRLPVTKALESCKIHIIYSSPYKRSYDTVLHYAEKYGMTINTDERLRERRQGTDSGKFLEKRWDDFNFCEENGESLMSVQNRIIEAVNEILERHPNKNIVIGTHGTALSTILNFYDKTFVCDGFKRIWHCMPYIIKLSFEHKYLKVKEELLKTDKVY